MFAAWLGSAIGVGGVICVVLYESFVFSSLHIEVVSWFYLCAIYISDESITIWPLRDFARKRIYDKISLESG